MVGVVAAVIFSVAIPVVIMAMLEPSLDRTAPKAGNFRGVMVYNGLGVVWFVWLVSFWVGDLLLKILGFEQPVWVGYIEPLFPVLACTCAFGLFDDWAGCNKIKGFRGHLRALSKGQLTTGGLKFLGIGCLSLLLAIQLYYDGLDTVPRVLLVTCVIALNANLMNLFDLRPGRAQKIYLLILTLAFATSMALAAMPFVIFSMPGWDIVALALAGIGPVLAVWRFDLGEKGMIGDAGANAMGVFLGYIFATILPIWPLFLLAVGLAVVNILSERVSFTKIIAANPLLSRLDGLGRQRDVTGRDVAPMPAAPQGPAAQGAATPQGALQQDIAPPQAATALPTAPAPGIAQAQGATSLSTDQQNAAQQNAALNNKDEG